MFLLSFATVLLVAVVQGQVLVGLSGVCTNSVQCVGLGICVNQRCSCPPMYAQIGASCVYLGYPGSPFPGGPYAPVAPAPIPRPVVPTYLKPYGKFPPYAYPGGSCLGPVRCLGGAICMRGLCGCPNGYALNGKACAPRPAPPAYPLSAPYFAPPAIPGAPFPAPSVFAAPGKPVGALIAPPRPVACPAGQVFIGSSCVPNIYMSRYPNMLCAPGLDCSGGAVCNGGICVCPRGYAMSNGYCSTPALPVAAAPFPPAGVFPAPSPPIFPGPLRPGFVGAPRVGVVPAPDMIAAPPPPPIPAPALPVPPVLPGAYPPPGLLLTRPGGSCTTNSMCVAGAVCNGGNCACAIPYTQFGGVCLRRNRKLEQTQALSGSAASSKKDEKNE